MRALPSVRLSLLEVLSDAVLLQILSENITLFPLPLRRGSHFEFLASAHSLFLFPKNFSSDAKQDDR